MSDLALRLGFTLIFVGVLIIAIGILMDIWKP